MGFLINQYEGFSGNVVEMASVATQCAQFLQLPGDLDKINERLIRYYVAEGLVDRPKRVGRDAEYGYVHLLQFLAARFLVDAGFPMQKVAPYLASLEIVQLEALVMNRTKPNMAELLVASFSSPQVGSRRAKRKDDDLASPSSGGPHIQVAARPSSIASESMRYDALSADLNAFASHIQSSISDTGGPDPSGRIDKLSDQINNLSDSIKQGLSDLLDRATDAAEKERMIFEEQFERMRMVMQEGWSQLRYEIDHERHHRQMQYTETQDKLDRLMAMMAEGKG
jgi:DNA-binding transcriptional MerR regulator